MAGGPRCAHAQIRREVGRCSIHGSQGSVFLSFATCISVGIQVPSEKVCGSLGYVVKCVQPPRADTLSAGLVLAVTRRVSPVLLLFVPLGKSYSSGMFWDMCGLCEPFCYIMLQALWGRLPRSQKDHHTHNTLSHSLHTFLGGGFLVSDNVCCILCPFIPPRYRFHVFFWVVVFVSICLIPLTHFPSEHHRNWACQVGEKSI